MKALIVAGAGEVHGSRLADVVQTADLVVAADSGAEALLPLRIPDVVIGDLDSISAETLNHLRRHTIVYQFPADKDHTDLELALRYAENEGATHIEVHGWTDGRLDYSWANILCFRHSSAKITLMGADFRAEILNQYRPTLSFEARGKRRMSILGLAQPLSLTTKGLKWELGWREMTEPQISLSNEFLDRMSVSLSQGAAVVITEIDVISDT